MLVCVSRGEKGVRGDGSDEPRPWREETKDDRVNASHIGSDNDASDIWSGSDVRGGSGKAIKHATDRRAADGDEGRGNFQERRHRGRHHEDCRRGGMMLGSIWLVDSAKTIDEV
jgi:hypothetical protein